MKTALLILSTESVAEVLHDEHALQTRNGIRRNELGHTVIMMWRGKVGKPEHAAECDSWRAIAEKFTDHLMQWLNASGVPSSEVDMTSACAAVSAENAARANRLQDELNRARARENDLIRDRDRLIHKDCATLHKQVQQLSAERDALASQANTLEQEKDAALHRLQASEERERRLSERLASIAALSTGS